MRELRKWFTPGCGAIFLNVAVSQTKQLKGKVSDAKDGTDCRRNRAGKRRLLLHRNGCRRQLSTHGSRKRHCSGNKLCWLQKLEVSVNADSSSIKIDESGPEALSEIVVVGYGTKIKKDITSSISESNSHKNSRIFHYPPLNRHWKTSIRGIY